MLGKGWVNCGSVRDQALATVPPVCHIQTLFNWSFHNWSHKSDTVIKEPGITLSYSPNLFVPVTPQ